MYFRGAGGLLSGVAPFNTGPSLVVISDDGRTRQIPIPSDGIVLGRDTQLGPPFSTDEHVSRNHVSVQRRGDVVEIADLGSANGTFVNGTRVRAPAQMQDSDVLRIGEIQLKLASPVGVNRTVRGGMITDADVACLTIVSPGAWSGRQFPLSGDYLVVGRGTASGIQIDDPHVSRKHAALRRRGDSVLVEDLGSASGTFVNGHRVRAPRALRAGDIVAFAGVNARFDKISEARPAPRRDIVNDAEGEQRRHVQHVMQQREQFLREIAAARTKARWLIGTGVLSFVAGAALVASGVLGFLKDVNGAITTGAQPSAVSPFGRDMGGIPSGFIGSAMALLGMLLLIVGIVLYVKAGAGARRGRRAGA
jgi:pSer/pThr/pTyr-binding forkhead associated (FHA) protein